MQTRALRRTLPERFCPGFHSVKELTVIFGLCVLAVAGRAQTTNPPPRSLNLTQCIDLALKQNPAVLKAQEELRRTRGLIVETRAQAIPNVTADGEYRRT